MHPRRLLFFSAAVLLLTMLYAGWARVPLIYDGSFQLASTLVEETPFYHVTRYHSWVLWQPVSWLKPHTSSVTLLQWVFAAPFLLAPVVALGLCWWLVRNTAPHLIVWAVFGICASTLPGQVFMVNDSIFQQHLFWPVFLGLLVPLTRWQAAVLVLLVAFQLSHQIGAVLMLLAAAGAAAVAIAEPEVRRSYSWCAVGAAVFAAACVAKMLLWPDEYAREEFTWEAAMARLDGIRSPSLVVGSLSLFAAAWLLHIHKPRPAAIALLLTASLWTIWATDAALWSGAAINYRRWIVPLTVPFFALAVWQRLRPPLATDYRVAAILPVLFAIVLGIQATQWRQTTAQLRRAISDSPAPVIAAESLPFVRHTAADHWSLPSLSLVLQGKQPQTIVVDGEAAPLVEQGVPLSRFWVKPRDDSGWFDWSALRPLEDVPR